MSAERDLLRRAKCLLECSNMEPLQRQTDLIVGEIKELLAQPEQEPFKPDWVNYRQGVADSKREPLSDGEITTNTPKTIPIGERLAFHAGIRWAEHKHGITGGQNE